MPGGEALKRAGLKPVSLEAKEGLALINGTQAMSAVGTIALNEAERVGLAADMAACLTMEALNGIISAFDNELLAVRPHPELEFVASRMRNWLEGSKRVTRQGRSVSRIPIRFAVFHRFTVHPGRHLIMSMNA